MVKGTPRGETPNSHARITKSETQSQILLQLQVPILVTVMVPDELGEALCAEVEQLLTVLLLLFLREAVLGLGYLEFTVTF